MCNKKKNYIKYNKKIKIKLKSDTKYFWEDIGYYA